jgi:hypothetical protein
MFYYKDTQDNIHALDSAEFEYLLPTGVVSITETEMQAILDAKQAAADAAPQPVPTSVTMKQARLALLAANLLDTVEANISALPKADQIEWNYSLTVQRASPLVASLATALNLTDAQVDQLFTDASAL